MKIFEKIQQQKNKNTHVKIIFLIIIDIEKYGARYNSINNLLFI